MRAQPRGKRIAVIVLSIVVLLGLAVLIAMRWAAGEIKGRIVEVLGPNGSAEQIDVGLYTVHLRNVRLGAPAGWPAADSLRAATIDIIPDWPAWFSHRLHLKSVVVDQYYQSVWRTTNGQLGILPGIRDNLTRMTQAHDADQGPSDQPRHKTIVQIDRIEFRQGQFDFFDEKIAKPPYTVHMSNFNATIVNLQFPALTDRSIIQINADLGGGKMALDGWMEFATRDSQIGLTLSGVEAKTLQPYLLKGQKVAIASGTIDLTLNWTVQNGRLNAPGKITLNHLQVANKTAGPLGELETLPKKAAVEALKDDNDRIDLNFVLSGDLNDPKFSIDEDLSKRIGAGVAKALGVTVEGVGKGAGDAAKGIGNALKSLIGQ
ncbi:DUF748 domain-containing protein [Pararobbsia alpina]|uniref:AsmA domain-containing protein n=1 Tax=Pararobbsia alpina TaxID=621374 RepID=A0A6S7BNQ3_9BURK|nr:DUF748 domain-containing protein [Pararobbsia alpina]CAB3797528.1 hypothetical protein LMG28138_04264 [Pararobbsia alpina]